MQWDLDDGEELLWSGRPRRTIAFRPNDFYWLPVGVLFTAFNIFWLRGVLSIDAPIALAFAAPGMLLLAIGVYVIVGRFLVDVWVRHRTRYALTSERILITSRPGFKMKSTALQLAALPTIEWTERWNKSGTITLAEPSEPGWKQWHDELTFLPTVELASYWAGFHLPWTIKYMPKQFERIDDVSGVYRRVLRAQHAARERHPDQVRQIHRWERSRKFET